MQPETTTLPVNGQDKQELTPIQQWDQLAFAVMFKELEQAGVRKQFIKRCQQVSASLIRGFRDKMTKQVEQSALSAQEALKYEEQRLTRCWFFQFRKKQQIRQSISFYKGKAAAYEDAKMGLQYQGIK